MLYRVRMLSLAVLITVCVPCRGQQGEGVGAPASASGEIDGGSGGAARIDWRADQSPVKNQGGRGTCTAFAVAAAIETFPGVPLDVSEQFLYALAKDQQTTRSRIMAGYYKRRSELKALFTDGATLMEYTESLPLYGACEERFFPYQPGRIKITESLAAALPKADSERLAKEVYSRTQFTTAMREKLRLLGKFDVTSAELVDFVPDHTDESVSAASRAARIRTKTQRLLQWLGQGGAGHRTIPISYVISKSAWSSHFNKPSIPVFTAKELPKSKEDASGHAVALVGWTPSLVGYVKGANPGDRSGYFIIKNSWGTKWGGLGGYGLVRADVHRATVKQALLIQGVKRRTSSAVHSPFDRAKLARGDWRLKVQIARGQAKGGETMSFSTYASDLRDPNLPAVRYVVKLRQGEEARRVVSPLIRRDEAPGYLWRMPIQSGVFLIDVTLVHHRVILTVPEPTSGVRFSVLGHTPSGRAFDVPAVPDSALGRAQAKAALSAK